MATRACELVEQMIATHGGEPLGARARAARYCHELREFDGLLLPVRREVFPRRGDNRTRARPRLVWIDIWEGAIVR